eukprot:6732529-Karenia_brevis.AAC.1
MAMIMTRKLMTMNDDDIHHHVHEAGPAVSGRASAASPRSSAAAAGSGAADPDVMQQVMHCCVRTCYCIAL